MRLSQQELVSVTLSSPRESAKPKAPYSKAQSAAPSQKKKNKVSLRKTVASFFSNLNSLSAKKKAAKKRKSGKAAGVRVSPRRGRPGG